MNKDMVFCIRTGCRKKACSYHQDHLSDITPPAIIEIKDMKSSGKCMYEKEPDGDS